MAPLSFEGRHVDRSHVELVSADRSSQWGDALLALNVSCSVQFRITAASRRADHQRYGASRTGISRWFRIGGHDGGECTSL